MTETRPEFHGALHQASHAVVAHALELPFGHVSLEQDPGSLGHLLHARDATPAADPERRARLAAVSVAGRLALEMRMGTVPTDPDLDPPDQWVTGADREQATATARQILEACWPAVTIIADLLITRERVTASEVAAAVRSAAPGMERPVPYQEHAGMPGVRRPSGAADSEDSADALPEGALVGGVDEGGGD
jgi:hypothetical protein